MELEKSLEEQKKELHLLIDSSTNNLVKNLVNIFEALKFDQSNVQSSGNIEINENMNTMANEINTLLNIVNKMKFRELKYQEEESINEGKQKVINLNNNIVEKLKKLTEIHENVENHLMEMKKSTFYVMAKYICTKPINQ